MDPTSSARTSSVQQYNRQHRIAVNNMLAQGLVAQGIMPPKQQRTQQHQQHPRSPSEDWAAAMEQSSSRPKWYSGKRLSFSKANKTNDKAQSTRTPSPQQFEPLDPHDMFHSRLSKDFDMRKLGGLQTIRRAPKVGL